MPDVGTWAKLAAYVGCIGLVLEIAHLAYWRVNRWVMTVRSGPALRALMSAVAASFPLVAVLLLTGAFCVAIDGRSLESLGLKRDANSLPQFFGGLTVAFTAISLLFLVGCSLGWFRIERSSITRERVPVFCSGLCDFSLAAVFEEIAIRGYVFSVLQHTWGGSVAVVGSAGIFTFFHLIKHPRMPLIFTLNAFFFGLLTGQARLVTGALWAPIGLHFGWNLAQGPIFGMPCSGRIYDSGLVSCTVGGPDWVTGGLYSPDAGIIGTATLIITTAALMTFMPIY